MTAAPDLPPDYSSEYFCDSPASIRAVRPFYWLATAVVLSLSGLQVFNSPRFKSFPSLAAFVLLILLYIGLMWVGPYLTTRRRYLPFYFVVQWALIFAISLLSASTSMLFGLSLMMAGQATGILERFWPSLFIVITDVLQAAAIYILLSGWRELFFWLIWLTALAILVCTYIAAFLGQAKARKHTQEMYARLEIANHHLSEYANQVEALTLANERQRIARELHDTLAQGMAGLVLQLEAVDAHLAKERPERARTILQEAMNRARHSLAETRQAIGDLRETPLDRAGLEGVLRQEVERFRSATGLDCDLEILLQSEPPDAISHHALQFVAEGLSNVARHACPNRAWVRLAQHEQDLAVEVGDDGVGFDPEKSLALTGHFGLLGIRERARLAGGDLVIHSAPGRGAILRLNLPLQNEAH